MSAATTITRTLLVLTTFGAALAASAASAVAEETPAVPVRGTARFDAALVPAGDVDTYGVRAATGQRLDVRVRRRGKHGVATTLRVETPEGELAGAESGASAHVAVDVTEGGTWRASVASQEPLATGAYRVQFTLRAPPRVRTELPAPGDDGSFRAVVPAVPGAALTLSVRFAGDVPAAVRLLAPGGAEISGVDDALRRRGSTLRGRIVLPDDVPAGEYTVVVEGGAATHDVRIDARVAPVRRGRVRLADLEPVIASTPFQAAVGEEFTFGAVHTRDPAGRGAAPTVFLGATPLEFVADTETDVTVRVPADAPRGPQRVLLRTATGQEALSRNDVVVAARPLLAAIAPDAGSSAGGFELTLTGRDLPAAADLRLLFDGLAFTPQQILEASPTRIRIAAPGRSAGATSVRVRDAASLLDSGGPGTPFTFLPTPRVDEVAPQLVTTLGGNGVTLTGIEFGPGDRVLLETGSAGVFQDLSTTQTTYVSPTRHVFQAPVRAPGSYAIVVESALGLRRTESATLRVFALSDATAALGLDVFDPGDLSSLATGDLDGDGREELVVAHAGSGPAAATSALRVLRLDGAGAFQDVTDALVPAPLADDDWRARRVRVQDVDGDHAPDVVIVTDDTSVPPSGRSGVRIFLNRAASGAPGGRALTDATDALAAPARIAQPAFGAGSSTPYVADDWRGLDVWVGDLDGDADTHAEIVLTAAQPFSEYWVDIGSYAYTPFSGGYAYAIYWPATRVLGWDAGARAGLGAFRFEADRLPRAQGLTISIAGAPPGVYTGTCNSAFRCEHVITPFAGTALDVADVDGDGRRDIVVTSPSAIEKRAYGGQPLQPWSSLQVALNRPRPTRALGTLTDVTAALVALGDLRADVVAVGAPDPASGGAIAIASRTGGGAERALRVLAWDGDDETAAFVRVDDDVLPVVANGDEGQAAALAFRDLDADGRDDLVLLAEHAPSPGRAALRVLFAHGASASPVGWRFARGFGGDADALVTGGDDLEGSVLALGDLDGGGVFDAVVGRVADTPRAARLRVLRGDDGR